MCFSCSPGRIITYAPMPLPASSCGSVPAWPKESML